eukprot:2841341-Alexandrium_andersonii.AAC.1
MLGPRLRQGLAPLAGALVARLGGQAGVHRRHRRRRAEPTRGDGGHACGPRWGEGHRQAHLRRG